MTKTMIRFMLILICVLSSGLLAQDQAIAPINMLDDSSFEMSSKQTSWSMKSDGIFRVDDLVARSGNKSLKWDNSDPETYKLVTQTVPLVSGRSYELSGWIKTVSVQGVRESGATIALGYSGVNGKYISGGPHPGGQKGTGDWWQLVAYTGAVPTDVSMGTFTCYVRKHGPSGKTFTGKAWWDDLSLRPVSMEVHQLKPAYKNRITDEHSTLLLEVNAWPDDYNLKTNQIEARLSVVDVQGKEVVFQQTYPFEKKASFAGTTIKKDLREIPAGEYDIQVDLRYAKTQQVLWQETRTIYRVAENNDQLKVHIDEHHRLIVKDEPFFPIGVYTRKAPVEDLKNTPFNCFMSYDRLSKKQMDMAQQSGLKVIYNLKDFYNKIWYSPSNVKSIHDEVPAMKVVVKKFRNHPALLAWYVNDELGPECLVEHRSHYKLLNEEDPHHPAWSLHNKPVEMTSLLDTADVMGIDTYPVPEEPLSKMAADMIATQVAVRRSKPVWAVPQIFNWSVFGREGRPPTLQEMRCMAWQAICNDATGLIFYSHDKLKRDKDMDYQTQWQAVKTMAGEVAGYANQLMSIESLPAITISQHAWLHWTARNVGDTLYIFAVNDNSGQGDVTFEVKGKVSSVQRIQLSSKQVEECQVVNGERWVDTITKSEVHIYKIEL